MYSKRYWNPSVHEKSLSASVVVLESQNEKVLAWAIKVKVVDLCRYSRYSGSALFVV